jgi:hypothetical protein
MECPLKKRLIMVLVFFLFVPLPSYSQKLTHEQKQRIESDAVHTFQSIVSLWKDGKFERLYDYGYLNNQKALSKEDFTRRMKNKFYQLALSWETIRDIDAEVISPRRVYVRAKIGFKDKRGGDTKFKNESFEMVFEGDEWRISLFEIIASP